MDFFVILHLSDYDDSDVALSLDAQPLLLEKVGLVERALFELTHEH